MKAFARRTVRDFWQLFVGIWLGIVGLCYVAWGASYSLIFNNTEQGPNSTASPVVNVSTDGTVTKSGGQGGTTPAITGLTAPGISAPAANGAASVAADPVVAQGATSMQELPSSPNLMRRVRVTTGAHSYFNRAEDTKWSGFGPSLGLGLTLVKGVGLNLHAGSTSELERWYGGADLELMPIQLSLGRFDNLIEAGGLVGASSLGRRSGETATLHWGARVNANLGEQWGVTTAARVGRGYVLAEGGLTLRF